MSRFRCIEPIQSPPVGTQLLAIGVQTWCGHREVFFHGRGQQDTWYVIQILHDDVRVMVGEVHTIAAACLYPKLTSPTMETWRGKLLYSYEDDFVEV